MGWISDINELSPRVKSFIVCIVTLLPFWYIIIYLFNPYIFFHSNMYLIIPLCFCFSILWYLLSLAINKIVIEFIQHKYKLSEENPEEEIILIGGLDSIIYLCVAIFLGYINKSKYDAAGIHYHFKSFLKLAFILMLVRSAIIAIGMILIHNDKSNNQQIRDNQQT